MEISVVIPAHNEADNVEHVVSEICHTLDGIIEYEIVIVDDGSTDESLQRLVSLQEKFPKLRIKSHSTRSGQSAALRTGVLAAEKSWILTMDGDGQNDPADIPGLIRAAKGNGQTPSPEMMVVGHRRIRRDSLMKKISSRIANTVRSRLLNDNTPDTGCGMKMFSRDIFLSLPYFDHMHRFLPALVQRNGGRVISVIVNHRPRSRGLSHYGILDRLWVGIIDTLGVMWLQRRNRFPLSKEVLKKNEHS